MIHSEWNFDTDCLVIRVPRRNLDEAGFLPRKNPMEGKGPVSEYQYSIRSLSASPIIFYDNTFMEGNSSMKWLTIEGKSLVVRDYPPHDPEEPCLAVVVSTSREQQMLRRFTKLAEENKISIIPSF